jgi:hypothetical protein
MNMRYTCPFGCTWPGTNDHKEWMMHNCFPKIVDTVVDQWRGAAILDKAAKPETVALLTKVTSDGSTASYYELPEGASELQHLISHRNMNAQIGEIFRSCYRMGAASHSDELRDAKKILFYAKAEVARLETRK